MTRHMTRVAIHGIFLDDGKLLMIRRKDTGYFDGSFGLPAGHLEPREFPIDALVRESNEEVGLNVITAKLAMVMHHRKPVGNPEYTHYFFLATSWSGEPRNMEPDKCSELRWIPVQDVGRRPDIIPYIGQAINYWRIDKNCTYLFSHDGP